MVILVSENDFGSVLFLSALGNSFRRIGIDSSLKAWKNLSMSSSGPWVFFLGGYLLLIQSHCSL
jgi:hypothetical protein